MLVDKIPRGAKADTKRMEETSNWTKFDTILKGAKKTGQVQRGRQAEGVEDIQALSARIQAAKGWTRRSLAVPSERCCEQVRTTSRGGPNHSDMKAAQGDVEKLPELESKLASMKEGFLSSATPSERHNEKSWARSEVTNRKPRVVVVDLLAEKECLTTHERRLHTWKQLSFGDRVSVYGHHHPRLAAVSSARVHQEA